MKKNTIYQLLLLLIIITIVTSFCKKEEQLPYKYEKLIPVLPDTVFNYSNPTTSWIHYDTKKKLIANVTDNGATLGRVLFYDTKLSKTNTISCGSCHHQENSFADNVRFSKGFDGAVTSRNSIALTNPIDEALYFWDGRETDLNHMVLQPIKNHIEMGLDDFSVMVKKLEAAGYYQSLFKKAFGDATITKERIASGLRQFVQSMICGKTRFEEMDAELYGDNDLPSDFSDLEKKGAHIYLGKGLCSNCHNSFGGSMSSTWADIGLDSVYKDKGLGTLVEGGDGKFKIPSLRNVTLSAPYMHDGRFSTLMEVVNHYSDSIQPSKNLDKLFGGGGNNKPLRMNLTPLEKEALVAFLGTLTDKTLINDVKYSNPFK
jgi:cytochrome c peroxidase